MSTDPKQLTRRRFLHAALTAPFAATLAGCSGDTQTPQDTPAPEPTPKQQSIFEGISFTDQHGKPFKPEELEQALIVFGYGGCPMCQRITDSLAAIQKKLLADGKEVPIVIVSVQPEKDRDDLKTYVSSYYVKGVKQLASEMLPDNDDARRALGERSFEAARNLTQRDRILHVICPPDGDTAKKLQTQLGLFQNPNNPQSHSSFITLVKHGMQTQQFRALPQGESSPTPEFMQDLATQISQSITSPARAR